MYEILPTKKDFMSYTVTDNHILTLKVKQYKSVSNNRGKMELSWFDKKELKYRYKDFDNQEELDILYSSLDDDNVIDITIEKYLSLPENVQKNLYVFKSDGINWEHQEVDLDPYILGMWLGDGLSHGYTFATTDKELLNKWFEWGVENDATITKVRHKYSIICNKTKESPLRKLLNKYGLVKNKHIPLDYIVNDRKTRLALLAGLIDTDGHVRANGHEIRICKGERNYKILYDAEFLVRSLGFSCHISDCICTYTIKGEQRQKPYKELMITGTNLHEIPTILPRKKLSKFCKRRFSEKMGFSFLQSSFELIKKDVQPYVGWQVEGSGRFLLADMSVTHNTPEGVSVGLVKNMSLISSITIASNSSSLRDLLNTTDVVMFDGTNVKEFNKGTKVIINGDIIGVHYKPNELMDTLKSWKRSGMINVCTGIYWCIYENEIWACTEGGRCIRPCYIVEDNKLLLNKEIIGALRKKEFDWSGLIIGTDKYSSVIEYLDVEETNHAMISMKFGELNAKQVGSSYSVNYTHMEMDPSLILGVLASSIPFSNHNQSPRNCYQCLGVHENVLMADGSLKMIKDVQIGDSVITFNPHTMNVLRTTVINQYVRETDKQMFRIVTTSGRVIEATFDHKFMTSTRNYEFTWKEVQHFGIGSTLVGIFPNCEPLDRRVMTETPILTEEMIASSTNVSTNVAPELIETLVQELKKMNMLPLYNTSCVAPTIARLFGYLGYVQKVQFTTDDETVIGLGNPDDAESFARDVIDLGFQARCVGRNKVCTGTGFTLFMLVLSRQTVPEWISSGSMHIKREFLAGMFGANGPFIMWNSLDGIFCTKSSHVSSPQTIVELMHSLGVKAQMQQFSIIINPEDDNIVNMFNKIGYRYNQQKMIAAASYVEYMKASKYAPGTHCLSSWLSEVVSKGSMLFVPIKSITPIVDKLISDITVDSECHAFIGGNGFAVHNSAMGKQAIGIYASNYRKRYDTLGHILNYPQVPLVQTRASKLVNNDKLPCGINVLVAIGVWTGYNQEDSIIMNQSAVDRGLFKSTYYRTYKDHNIKNHSTGEEEYFCNPDEKTTKQMKPFNYKKLNKEGFVEENTMVEAGDIIIGKCMPQKIGNVITNKDTSVVLKNNEKGFIDKNCYGDKNCVNVNGDGYTFAKVRIRSDRTPCIGDKFSCYTPDHEVLTTEGWMRIDQLTTKHKVATLVDDALVYQRPTEVQTYDFDGKLYVVKSNHVDLKVTPNHRMYVMSRNPGAEYRMELAKEIYGARRHYKKNVDKFTPKMMKQAPPELVVEDGEVRQFKIEGFINANGQWKDEMIFDIDDWITLFGIWMAEGSCQTGYVHFAANKPRVKEALDRICNKMYLTIYKQKMRAEDTEENDWRIHNQPLPKFMKQYSVGALKKSLPSWVWFLSRDKCKLLIDSMCLGDGHVMANGTRRYDTSSTQLADDFQRLCLHAGYSCNKAIKAKAGQSKTTKDGKKTITSTSDAYRLTIITAQNEPLVNKNKVVDDPESWQDAWEDYNGTVHCCTVPKGEGILYMRRNGVVIWSGNSRHGQKGTVGMMYRQQDMPFDGIDGTSPDIIINPHAIPSRMTIAQLMETIMGNACAGLGTFGDATPFTELSVEDIANACETAGLERYGNTILYNSRTGEQMDAYIFKGVTNYQRLKHMVDDKIHCSSKDHDVLTTDGWIPIPEVTMAHKVATLKDGKLVYEHPIKVLEFPDYNGKMYHISNQAIDLNVTINHRMWVSTVHTRAKQWSEYKHIEAGKLVGKHVKYQKDAEWDADDYQFILPSHLTEEEKTFDMDAWLTFFGIWTAEGCADNGTTKSYGINVCVHKKRVKDVIFTAVEKLGYSYSVNNDVLQMSNKQLHAYLKVLSVGATNNSLPDWVWSLSTKQAQLLIDSMILGERGNSVSYYTGSIKLADDVMRLSLHAGWSATKYLHIQAGAVNVIHGKDVITQSDVWRLSINKTRNRPAVNHGHHKEQDVQKEKVYDYEGPVYCLQVPSEVFMVRRNGKACWTGNSRAANGPVVSLTRQPAEGRARDGGLRLGEMEIECNWAHGTMQFLKERFMECSDNYRVFVCKKCGIMANVNPEKGIYACKPCKNTACFSEIRIPYSCKLLFQEVQTMGIAAKFLT